MLQQLTARVWVYPFEEARDRPNLGYIRGDRWSLAVDAGHSRAHVKEFYRALEAAGLPLPSLTVLTHWHWDHTFGMHAVQGLCLANRRTNRHLLDFRGRLEREGSGFFLAMDASICLEYPADTPVTVVPADLSFMGEMRLDAGNCPIRVMQAESPHTDDATLILVPEEGLLFLGDACCDPFEGGARDPALCRKLAETIAESGAERCLEGHWQPLGREETIRDLLDEQQG